ncbi:MAG: hypothetical protein WC802_00950 [Patescibacteria group bacterium]|jgi:hypothetical protein
MKIVVWKADGAVVENVQCEDGLTVKDDVTFSLVTFLSAADDMVRVSLDVNATSGEENYEFENSIQPQLVAKDQLIDLHSFFVENDEDRDGDLLLSLVFDQIMAPATTLALSWHYADGDRELVDGVEMRVSIKTAEIDYVGTHVIDIEEAESYFILEEDPAED